MRNTIQQKTLPFSSIISDKIDKKTIILHNECQHVQLKNIYRTVYNPENFMFFSTTMKLIGVRRSINKFIQIEMITNTFLDHKGKILKYIEKELDYRKETRNTVKLWILKDMLLITIVQ